MRKTTATIFITLTVLMSVLPAVLTPTIAFAQDPQASIDAAVRAAENADPAKNPNIRACSFSLNFSILACVAELANIWLGIVSKAVAISGWILDKAMHMSILDMGDYINGEAGDDTLVEMGWTIFRDLANIVFIFLILWVAIQTILGLGSGDPTGAIARIIVAGLLINFSLFIAQAVVDASNVVAVHFWDLLNPPNSSISAVFMEPLRISTIYDSSVMQSLNFTKILMVAGLGTVFLVVTAWVLFALAALFIIRLVVLSVIFVLAPLAFVSWVVPGLRGHMSRWWNTLFKQAFFAPIAMIMLYIVARGAESLGNAGQFSELFSAENSDMAKQVTDMSLATNFVLILALLVASGVASYSIGAYGSSMVQSWGRSLKGWGLGKLSAPGRGAASLANRAIGRVGKDLSETDKMKEWKDRPSGLGRMFGGALARGADKMQKVKVFGKGRSYEEARKGGGVFSAGEEEIKDQMNKKSKDPAEMANYFGSLSENQQKMAFKNLSVRNRALLAQEANKSPTIKSAVDAQVGKLAREEKQNLEDEVRKLGKRSAEMAKEASAKAVAEALKTQMADFIAGKNITVSIEGVSMPKTPSEVTAIVKDMSADDLADMDKGTLEQIVGIKDASGNYGVDGDTFSKFMAKSNVSQDMRDAIRAKRYEALETLARKTGKTTAEETELAKMMARIGNKEAQFIDKAVITSADFVKNINASILQGLVKAGESIENMDKIEAELENILATPGLTVNPSLGKAYNWLQANKRIIS